MRELIVDRNRANQLKQQSLEMNSITLSKRRISDLELIVNGGFYPLKGFMNRRDYLSVLESLRLENGMPWTVPICLDIDQKKADTLQPGETVALLDQEGFMLAVLHVEDIWRIDKNFEADQLYGTRDPEHQGVDLLVSHTKAFYVGGTVEGVQYPIHYAFRRRRHTPNELISLFRKLGWRKIIGYHTRQPMHKVHFETALMAMETASANLLIHPIVEQVSPGDIDTYTRIKCYLRILDRFPPNMAILSLLPLSVRFAGFREVILNAIIRKNYGCTHFLLPTQGGMKEKETDQCPGSELAGHLPQYEQELGIRLISMEPMAYDMEEDEYLPVSKIQPRHRVAEMTDEEFHQRIRSGKKIPEWYTFPEISEELKKVYPPRHRQGFTVFCTGFSGAGKSTIAKVLYARFLEMGGRPVTLLDGDIVRKNLSSELGFSKEHRDINVRRIGFVAGEITKNKGIAICAPIAPYEQTRRHIRNLIENYGGFVEVYVSTPLQVCEQRDRKGLYAKARAGLIKGYTGVDDPYEPPQHPEVTIDTTRITPDEAAQEVLLFLERANYIR